ncbi:MAG: PEP-CTERM sorting domain-containing protein [Cyanobacteria bacterium P01_D01_bin.36]
MKSILSFALKRIVFSASSIGLACLVLGVSSAAQASTFTKTSLTNGGELVPAGVSEVGGIVLDLVGTNNNRVTTQLSASSLFSGFASGNPLTIGTQTGFDASVTNALGGGILEAAIRITLDDGDTAVGDFDEDDNSLLLNGIDFGNWSDVIAQNTDNMGNAAASGFSTGGFRNNRLDTGWFFNNDATTLGNFYNSLIATQQVVFGLDDIDPGDNFLDFTQGVDASLVNVGTGPVVTPVNPTGVPEPGVVFGLVVTGIAASLSRKSKLERA